MVVASQTWTLSLPGCASLKDKRSVLRSLRDRLRGKFNVAVAETGLQSVHGRAEITMVFVANDGRMVQSVLDNTDHFVECHRGVVISRTDRDLY